MNKNKEGWTYHGTLHISNLRVLKSAAGYFIGRVCVETDENNEAFIVKDYEEIYSRESGYFPTYRSAEDALLNGFQIRDCGENNYAYDKGTLPDIRK